MIDEELCQEHPNCLLFPDHDTAIQSQLCEDHPYCFLPSGHPEAEELTDLFGDLPGDEDEAPMQSLEWLALDTVKAILSKDAPILALREWLCADLEKVIVDLEDVERAESADPHKYVKVHVLLRHARNLFNEISQ